jgi:hypothetical protein
MSADTMNCALSPPGWAAAVMITVPAIGGPAGSRSMMLLISGSTDARGPAVGRPPWPGRPTSPR